MIESTRLLDIYRKSIVSDEETFRILSLLVREGPLPKDEIDKRALIERHRATQKLRELYQSSLVKVGEQLIELTDYASLLLSKLGLTELAAKSFIPVPEGEAWKFTFLQACVEANYSFDDTQQALNLLRSFERTARNTKDQLHNFKGQARPYYVLVVGLDPDSQAIGGAEYFKSVVRWHRTQDTDFWRLHGNTIASKSEALIYYCQRAIRDAKDSDQMLAGEPIERKQQPPQAVYWATVARLVNAVLYNPDHPYRDMCFHNPQVPDRTAEFASKLELVLMKTLMNPAEGLHLTLNSHTTLSQTLARKLRNMLFHYQPHKETLKTSLLNAIVDNYSNSQSQHSVAHSAMIHLLMLHEQLDSGLFDDLTSSEQELLCTEANRLSSEFSSRLNQEHS